MKYGKLKEDKTIDVSTVVTLDKLRKEFSNYSFTEDNMDEFLKVIGYVKILNPDYNADLKQTSNTRLDDSTIILTEDGDYKRVLTLVEIVDETLVALRRSNKLKERRAYINKELKETDYTTASDFYLMRDEWKAYRDNLKNLLADNDTDPFLYDLGTRPNPYKYHDLENAKISKKAEIKAAFLKEFEGNTRVTTSLGFDVDGNERSLNNFKIGKKQGILTVKDADNNYHDIKLEDYDIIISAIEAEGLRLYTKKWDLEKAIDDKTEIPDVMSISW